MVLGQIFLRVLQFSPVYTLPPMLHTSVLPCLYPSTNAPHSSSSKCWSYKKGKWAMPGDLPKSSVLSKVGKRWTEQNFHLYGRESRYVGCNTEKHVTQLDTHSNSVHTGPARQQYQYKGESIIKYTRHIRDITFIHLFNKVHIYHRWYIWPPHRLNSREL